MTSPLEHLRLLYRSLFVIPLRGALYGVFTKVRPALAYKPPRPHPIDAQYGIDTSGAIFGDALRSGNAAADIYSTAYAGSQPGIIRKVLQLIPRLEDSTFLDLGCGKGRALAVASEFPLREIIGVELSPKMAAIARANARIMNARFPERTAITVLEGDASNIMMPEGQVIVFLYHPFFKRLMKKVAAAIESTLAVNPGKKIFVAYANPVFGDVFDAAPHLRRLFAANIPFAENERGTGIPVTDVDDTVVIWESIGPVMETPHANTEARIKLTRTGWRARVAKPSASSRIMAIGDFAAP